jgi:hypothetical protein
MPPDELPEPQGSKVIARFSAEQTARFFGGGDLGRPAWADPETQRKQDRQRLLLRGALTHSVQEFAEALRELSPQSSQRLMQLGQGALNGDKESLRLFTAMYTELLAQALVD